MERALQGKTTVESLDKETRRLHPPLLFDLTELQRTANRLYGFSAQKTLDTAQSLYERHKLISYPRTDSRHLSKDVSLTLPRITANIAGPYQSLLAPETGSRPLGPRFVDDSRVTDHHAIIPTETPRSKCNLSSDEEKIYDLLCRRLLAAWHADYICSVTTVITRITLEGAPPFPVEIHDRYHTSGMQVLQPGWKIMELETDPKKAKDKNTSEPEISSFLSGEEQALPAFLAVGQSPAVTDAEILKKTTRPPKRFTEATLLTAMETAGRTLEEKELSEAMKECGLGTPATRAAMIEILLKRSYIERQGKNLSATEKGIRLIQAVHPEVKSPAMTGQWEAYLKRIEKGKDRLEPFIQGIERFVGEVIGKIRSNPTDLPSLPTPTAATAPLPVPTAPDPQLSVPSVHRSTQKSSAGSLIAAPTSPRPAQSDPLPLFRQPASALPSINFSDISGPTGEDPLHATLHRVFGFTSFRPNQEDICRATLAGKDVLVVMPTGSGKSLCYQLPGLVRGGLTLIISPLIALMEDQATQLQARGLSADRIHSGRSRQEQRQAARLYLEGRLDFLFIAPERLRVPGFSEMLARRKPNLIAIDEAHCISQWGHDFRPDYRMLKQHLPLLRPTPVIALTATATPLVQDDIADQLALSSPFRAIHGFRRENIAIEVVEAPPSSRPNLTKQLLREPGRRPAIVYVPTRKHAEKLASELQFDFPAAPYHAGMETSERDRVQTAFLGDEIRVIVATIAFGMGIDKPNVRTVIHTAMPGSVEGYYQEIGRAGRDGLPSRAVLFHSYADRFTHEFFFGRDYPEVSVLSRLYDLLRAEPEKREDLRKRCRMEPEVFDKVLEKLWIHGGALVDAEDHVLRGNDDWPDSYQKQRDHKKAQMEQMQRYADLRQCRMFSLVRYFGDTEDQRESCGLCDFCSPQSSSARSFHPANQGEYSAALHILASLRNSTDGIASGRLYDELAQKTPLDRKLFERILDALTFADLVRSKPAVFQKDGRRIEYRRLQLTENGWERASSGQFTLQIAEEIRPESVRKKAGSRKAEKTTPPPAPDKPKAVRKKTFPAAQAQSIPAIPKLAPPGLREALRFWRLSEAKRKRVPAFHILSDRAVDAMASICPRSREELLTIPGIGPKTVEKYGTTLLQILRQF